MSVVKITDKEKLDRLLAKISFRLGKKPTQQEVLDLCVELGEEYFEELIEKLNPGPKLDNEKINRIIKVREKLAKIEWITPSPDDFISEDDAEIYGRED